MKRNLLIAAAALTWCSFALSLKAQQVQPKIYTSAKPMTFGHNLRNYYLFLKQNIDATLQAVPDDKFYATPPGFTKDIGAREQASIGAEAGALADAQYRMCMGIVAGKATPPVTLPGTIVMKEEMPTKAEMLDAVAKSFAACDPLFDNFDDSKITAMVNSLHAFQPLGTTLFNVLAHNREDYGRIKSYMVVFGIKSPAEVDTRDPGNPQDLYYCGSTAAKTPDSCQ